MKKFLAIFSFLASVLTARAELSVEWIDGNTIRVWGTGYTVVTNNVCTNGLGTCTNCVQISPEQMHEYKISILSQCDSAYSQLEDIGYSLSEIILRSSGMRDDISTFRRFGNSPGTGGTTTAEFQNLTNYVSTTDNTQTALVSQYLPATSLAASRIMGYNNGIYDYATQYVISQVDATYDDATASYSKVETAKSHIDTIRTTVRGMSEAACQCSGGGDGDGDCGDCPCAEQLDAIKDYVYHIDDDFHVQLRGMSAVTNFIPRMDAYAKTVSGVLYNDGTIVVDDGENSWSNVYRRGSSDLYDYNKSNILQRIELLVFGMTAISSATNWGEVGEVDNDVTETRDQIEGVRSVISQNHRDLSSHINIIKRKVQSLFDTLNFFGAGSLSEFSLCDPYAVQHFGNYSFEVTSTRAESLGRLRSIFRTCFQVFYWVSGICFMIFFWYWIISFTIKHVLGLLRFFNSLLT